jgi:glucose-6-phosphate isomerase
MKFDPGFDIAPLHQSMDFRYGDDCFGPEVENRLLNDIRSALRNPECDGPEIVYSIAMDVGKLIHRPLLEEMHLLYGVVMYAAGRLGEEPIRSQGHIHRISPLSLCHTPEVYEIWEGEGVIYMQEYGDDEPGRCFAISAKAGETVIVPPGWTHATISANPSVPLVFGAWCDREYGFVYDKVRAHKGIAWFPLFDANGKLKWEPNSHYKKSELICKPPEQHPNLGIVPGKSIYTSFEQNPDAFLYVPFPQRKADVWQNFIP